MAILGIYDKFLGCSHVLFIALLDQICSWSTVFLVNLLDKVARCSWLMSHSPSKNPWVPPTFGTLEGDMTSFGKLQGAGWPPFIGLIGNTVASRSGALPIGAATTGAVAMVGTNTGAIGVDTVATVGGLRVGDISRLPWEGVLRKVFAERSWVWVSMANLPSDFSEIQDNNRVQLNFGWADIYETINIEREICI